MSGHDAPARWESAAHGSMPRSSHEERAIVSDAARSGRVEAAQRLAGVAQSRAGDGPVLLTLPGGGHRSLVTEAFEELADLGNYLPWELRLLEDAGETKTRRHDCVTRALSHIIEAWALLEEATDEEESTRQPQPTPFEQHQADYAGKALVFYYPGSAVVARPSVAEGPATSPVSALEISAKKAPR